MQEDINNHTKDDDDYLKIRDVMKKLKISYNTVRSLILPNVDHLSFGKVIRIKRESLDNWIESRLLTKQKKDELLWQVKEVTKKAYKSDEAFGTSINKSREFAFVEALERATKK